MQHFTVTPEYLASQGLSPTFPERFWSKVNKDGPIPSHCPKLGKCWVWTAAKDGFGYGLMGRGTHTSCPIRSHVASWVIHYGPVENGRCVCHHCDNPACCRPDHLFIGDVADNNKDKTSKGRQSKGESHGRRKLNSKQVEEIRTAYASGSIFQRDLAIKFGVCEDTVWRIVNLKNWLPNNQQTKPL